MAIENEPFEDVFPIEKWGFSSQLYWFTKQYLLGMSLQVGEVGEVKHPSEFEQKKKVHDFWRILAIQSCIL